ncbi:transcriptional regulator, TetR family [Leptospira wolbachii serovar Codice str. CDC]|uniref:Transcriptional regulator, TetR family n=1 Tax=Leptospira wolbachii serovar Codice str. CDC TaxID=1218599 RepID=R8ZY21_9LEPT|nr:TetR/AcrR family transcriptional regulator [Leptospira wolbachii]EOQ94747.1 transcriptional regulator, TetR family [Leptospira wolbachii serovar Codice str. CDC]
MKQKIIQAALKICEKEGYESFSMRKLATKLELDPMAIYHYFDNKEELTKAMVEQIFNRFQEEALFFEKNSNSSIKKILITYWNLFIDYPGMSLYLIKNSHEDFPSVLSLNQKLKQLLQKSYPVAETEKILNILIDFIHGNALAFTSFSKGKIKEVTLLANRKEFETALVYLLNQFSKI